MHTNDIDDTIRKLQPPQGPLTEMINCCALQESKTRDDMISCCALQESKTIAYNIVAGFKLNSIYQSTKAEYWRLYICPP